MNCKSILFFALVVAAACAQDVAPESTEDVVPESNSLVETMASADEEAAARESEDAHAEASDYLKKAGAGACKSLADATEKEVQDNVKAQQDILNKIDKGAKCPEEGQDAITAMQNKVTKAEKDKKAADKAYDDALNVDVDFGKRKFNSLTKGQCGTFFSSTAYTNAEKKVADAKKKKDQAAGAVTSTKKDLQAAKDAAVIAVKKCQCNTYKAHQAALEAANKQVVDSNTKAWTKAAHLKCVLAGKTTNQCTVPALPKVKGVTMAAGVTASKCSAWAGHPQCGNCILSGKVTDNFLGRVYRQNGNANWDSGCYMKAQVPSGADRSNNYQLLAQWNGHGSGRGGNVHAMWGISDPKNTQYASYQWKHSYYALDYAYYCSNLNGGLSIYERGQSKSQTGGCNCGSWSKTTLTVDAGTNGAVRYYLQSNQHGKKLCYTSTTKASKGPYIVDESLYGKYCDMVNLELQEYKNGKWGTPS